MGKKPCDSEGTEEIWFWTFTNMDGLLKRRDSLSRFVSLESTASHSYGTWHPKRGDTQADLNRDDTVNFGEDMRDADAPRILSQTAMRTDRFLNQTLAGALATGEWPDERCKWRPALNSLQPQTEVPENQDQASFFLLDRGLIYVKHPKHY